MAQEGILWGVATAAYQVEGGLNGPREPANNWAPWDRSGRVEPVGGALGFWERPDDLLDRAAALGCNAFRMSIEWARVQPSDRSEVTSEPDWDHTALDRYADILCRARARGLEPVVTLVHFTHPLWCGYDLWLDPASPGRVGAFVRRCVRELGRRLAERGEAPVRWWITINEPAVVPFVTYLFGVFPGGTRGASRATLAYDHTISAHVLAYDAVHDVYSEEGWPQPMVSTNTVSLTLPALDALLVDALLARERGVSRASLRDYLRAAQSRARARLAAVPRAGALASVIDVAVDRISIRIGLKPEGAAFAALYDSPRLRKLDYVAFDYYDAVVGNWLRPASRAARELRRRPAAAELWEQVFRPDGLAVFLRQAHLQAPDRPILVAENGMCTPGMRPRPDCLTRDVFLRAMCAEVLRARDEGVPIAGYLHWTLVDNYEWGSYTPRFGIHGREAGRILDADATGVDAASVFKEIAARASCAASPSPPPPAG